MEKYSFEVHQNGRGGYIQCRNNVWDIKYDIEMMASGKPFVIYIQKERLPDTELILELDRFLRETKRDWEMQLIGDTKV